MNSLGESSTGGAGHILDAFKAERIPASPLPFRYRLSLIFVAVVMVLLPLLYLGLIGLSGYAVYLHAVTNADLLDQPSIYAVLLTYFGPLVVGVVGILFLIKPLFAKPLQPPPPFVLQPGSEPALEAFVHRIADAADAPRPRQIELDCNVNAAASLRKGLISLFGRDLTLLIGLPLVAGMSLRAFGGVLAHEFGHFSQGAGMRLTYLIRRINGWFARVVYERDQMDVWLDQAASTGHLLIVLVFQLARFFVFLSRRVLWVLMFIGNAISCFALRQMEYDADSYAAGFAGSPAFAETSNRVQELAAGWQRSMVLVQETWRQGRISNDFPALSLLETDTLDGEKRDAMSAARAEARTAPFDTHPCDADRIKAAEQLARPGIFHLDAPASVLFSDFPATCRRLTAHFYEHELGLEVSPKNLVDNDTLVGAQQAMNDELGAIKDFLQGTFDVARPVFVTRQDLAEATGSPARLRRELGALHGALEASFKQYAETGHQRAHTTAFLELARIGVPIYPAAVGIPHADKASLEKYLETVNDERRRLERELAPFDDKVRALLAVALVQDPQVRHQAEPWLDQMSFFQTIYAQLLELADAAHRLGTLLNNLSSGQMDEKQYEVLQLQAAVMETALENLRPALEDAIYPFEHAEGRIVLWQFVQPEPPDAALDAVVKTNMQVGFTVDQLFRLYQRVLGHLCVLAREGLERSGQVDATPIAASRDSGVAGNVTP